MTIKKIQDFSNDSYPDKSIAGFKLSSFRLLGIVLIIAGCCLAATAYFITGSVPLTGLGLVVVILGLACVVLDSKSQTSSDVSQLNRLKYLFLISLAVVLGIANVLLAVLGQNDLSVYFITDSIIYLIITLACINLDTRSKVALNHLGTLLFVVFLVVLALKIVQIMK